MAEVVRMPKMSDTMTEGVIAKWHKQVGDKVNTGDLVAEVETDKATMDFESFQEGTLLYIGAQEGSAAPVDSVIAILGAEGEDYKSLLEGGSPAPEAVKTQDEAAETLVKEESNNSKEEGSSVDPESVGATVIRMPLLSDTMTEGVIAEWHKKVGDTIKSDDTLADVETDKATMEVTAYADGVLLYIGVENGQAAKVNDVIAIVGKEGTDVQSLLKGGPKTTAPAAQDKPAQAAAANAEPAQEETSSHADANSRIKASPLAKKIAQEKGIDLSQIKGSAEGGRIIKKDVEEFTPSAKTAQPAASAPVADKAPASSAPAPAISIPQYTGEEKFTEKPVTQMRKVIAKRLSESLFTAPHIFVTMSIDMDSAMEARKKINEYAPVKISFNDLVLKASAIALKQHPVINSSWLGDKIRTNEHVHIGVAVAVDEGLVVPVVRFADGKSLSHISMEVKDFAQKAKSKKLQPAEMEGSTFTISNLGMFGVDEFTAIINSPNAAILAVSGIQQIPVVKNGAVVPGNVMKVTLSGDHRVVDGASAAAYLQTLKALLEEPVRLLV